MWVGLGVTTGRVKERNGKKRVQIFDKLKVSKACEKARGMSAQRQGGEFDTNQCIIVEIFWKRGMSGKSLGGGREKPIINT